MNNSVGNMEQFLLLFLVLLLCCFKLSVGHSQSLQVAVTRRTPVALVIVKECALLSTLVG